VLEREEVPSEDMDFAADETEFLEIEEGAANPRGAIGEGEALAFARILGRREVGSAGDDDWAVKRGEEFRGRLRVC